MPWSGSCTTKKLRGALFAAQERYETHHHCMYDADAVNGAVVLSARYIADRQLPDKAIDLMDEAGSRVRIAAHAAGRAALASGRLLADRAAPWLELQQVLEAKEEAIKVHALAPSHAIPYLADLLFSSTMSRWGASPSSESHPRQGLLPSLGRAIQEHGAPDMCV